MPVSQVKHCLMRKLLRMVRTRATLEDDSVVGVNDVKVADPSICGTIDVTFDELGKLLRSLTGSKPESIYAE